MCIRDSQYTIKVNVDDIVVLGTDGVFDNLFSYDILHIVNETMGVASRISQSTAKELATRIASAAYSRSIMQDVKTPFQQKMKRVERKTWLSGCLLYTSPSPRDLSTSRMPSSA
eukprot:TRINITY_DN6965_c0_g1_i1.p1 TRINITY_DN6965_c0_g1~~TRINITY_DN6965_c0_g1_i1.p1  ORF type:complete len:114 (-),score=23.42 TRINITY_DN6965_c0_g1_i1:162-503(-)